MGVWMYRYSERVKSADVYMALIVVLLNRMTPDELERVRAWLAEAKREGLAATLPVLAPVYPPSRN